MLLLLLMTGLIIGCILSARDYDEVCADVRDWILAKADGVSAQGEGSGVHSEDTAEADKAKL